MAWSSKTWETLYRWGVPLSDGTKQNINYATMLQVGGNPVVTNDSWFLLDFGTYSNYYSTAYDQLLFESKYAYNGGNRLYFVKSANSDLGAVELRKPDNSVVFNFSCVSTAPLLFPRMCGDTGTPPGVTNVQVHLTFNCVQNVNDGTKGCMPSIQALISSVGRVNYPEASAFAFYCNPGSMNVLGSATQLEQYLDACLNGDYWEEDTSVAPIGGSGGGGGSYSNPDVEIPIPGLPSISAVDTGFMSVYETTSAEMNVLAGKLWDATPSGFYDTVVKNYQSPFENIISVSLIPMNGLTGTSTNIKVGNYSTPALGTKLSTTFYEYDFGTIDINRYYNTFADYDRSITAYLPYIGNVPIDIDSVMNGKINVIYHCDVFSGSCVAYIRCFTNGHWHLISSYSGNIKADIPICGTNYMNMYNGILGTIATGLTGNYIGTATTAMSNMMNAYKPEFMRSGSVGATAGMMGVQFPYLIISTPNLIVAETFNETKGVVSNLTVTIGEETGFLSADTTNADLENIPCTQEELTMLRDILAGGIYI